MIIKIKEKEYEVRFGIRFIRELDKTNSLQKEGIKFGAGLELKVPMLLACDAVTLSDILYTGTITEKSRPSLAEVDDYVDNCDDIKGLFDEVLEELKKSNATKLKMEQIEEDLAKNEKK